MGGENATIGPPTASSTPAPRQDAGPVDRDAKQDVAHAENQAGGDQLPQPDRRALAEVVGE